MKTSDLRWLGLVVFLASPLYAAVSPATAVVGAPGPVGQASSGLAPASTGLSAGAAEVVKLSSAGFSDEVVLAYVEECRFLFNLSPEAIVRLKETGVSAPVISAMLAHDGSLRNQKPAAPDGSQPQAAAPDLMPVDQTPPPAPAEVIPVAPGPDYYWIPGYWGWNAGWIWNRGCWGLRGGYGWGGYHGRGWYGHRSSGGYHGGGGSHGVHGGHAGHAGGGGHGGGGHGR